MNISAVLPRSMPRTMSSPMTNPNRGFRSGYTNNKSGLILPKPKLSVLMVDDDPAISLINTMLLERANQKKPFCNVIGAAFNKETTLALIEKIDSAIIPYLAVVLDGSLGNGVTWQTISEEILLPFGVTPEHIIIHSGQQQSDCPFKQIGKPDKWGELVPHLFGLWQKLVFKELK